MQRLLKKGSDKNLMTNVTGSFQRAWHYAKMLKSLPELVLVLHIRKLRFRGRVSDDVQGTQQISH